MSDSDGDVLAYYSSDDEDASANQLEEENINLDQLTLDFMVNKYVLHQLSPNKINKTTIRDICFYRRRIMNLTNQLLQQYKNNTPYEEANVSINDAFVFFAKCCIDHFKLVDTNDLFQKDYLYIANDASFNLLQEEEKAHFVADTTDIDQDFLRKVQLFSATNQIRDASSDDHLYCPQQRKINLKDASLKNKGVSKKKKCA